MNIVLVYLGSYLPDYVILNLRRLIKLFPQYSVLILVDHDHDIDEDLSNNLFKVSIDSRWLSANDLTSSRLTFREGFWYKTLARFEALRVYSSLNPSLRILHVESDVWLSPSFPLSYFSVTNYEIAYPLANEYEGVASTLFLKNYEAIQNLCQLGKELFAHDQSLTDVILLGKHYRCFPDKVLILPTMTNFSPSFNIHVDGKLRDLMSKNVDGLPGIFDASTWGQFLTGKDPQNDFGFRIVFKYQRHHAIDPRPFSFSIDQGRLFISFQNNKTEVFSLHIHSKDKRIFRINDQKILLRRTRFYEKSKKIKFEFVPRIFIMNLPTYIKYTIYSTLKYVKLLEDGS